MKSISFFIVVFLGMLIGICVPIYSSQNDETKVENFDYYLLSENQTDFCADPSFVCESTGSEGDKVSDPYDCQSYYVCGSNGAVEQENCQEGFYFDPIDGNCISMSNDSCSVPCDCLYNLEEEDEGEEEYDEHICDPYKSCTHLDEYCLVPNPQDCHSYFECSSFSETATEKTCPDGYGFDLEKHYCTKEQANCNKPCPCEYDKYNLNVCDPTKSCELLGPECLVANPQDDQKYYKCDIDDGEVILHSKECSENLYFNTEKHFCSNTSSSSLLCNCNYDANPDYCDPISYCENLESNCLVPDPNDGRKYYTCSSFKNSSYFDRLDCPPGLYFDLENHFCTDDQPEYDKPCLCDYDLFETDSCDPSRSCEILGSSCLVPDPYNCHNYYSCSSFLSGESDISINSIDCPDGFYFNTEKHYCTLEATHCTCSCSCNYNNADPCDPGYTCQNLDDRCLVPDPDDCHYYFECATFNHNFEDLESEKIHCPDGQYFDSTLHFCTKGPTNCTHPCNCDYTSETLNLCDPLQSCKELGEGCLVPDPSNRHNYFICSNTTAEIIGPEECDSGYYFDYDTTHHCQFETGNYENPCKCNYTQEFDVCNPFEVCQKYENCLIPDPSDCHNYYSCANTNVSLSCPEGFYYDIEREYCVMSEGSCSIPCTKNCVEKASELDVCDEPSYSCQILGEVGQGCKVIDPSDCHNYFTCTEINGTIVAEENPIPCTEGFYFNFTEQDCLEDNGLCNRECVNDECAYSCLNANMNISDPTNCSNYFSCEDPGNPTKKSCGDSAIYFNGTECTTNKYTCCSSSCIPYCPYSFIEVEDPCNCKNYYLCNAGGVPTENMKYSCPDGKYFEESKGTCTELVEETCQNKCNCTDTDFV